MSEMVVRVAAGVVAGVSSIDMHLPVYADEGEWIVRPGMTMEACLMLMGLDYLMPITMDSGPRRCSTRVEWKPAFCIQPMQSAPV